MWCISSITTMRLCKYYTIMVIFGKLQNAMCQTLIYCEGFYNLLTCVTFGFVRGHFKGGGR
jgi:hypothetical protein